MKRIVAFALVCVVHVASAAPRSVLVLKSEGTADTSTRTTMDSHVLRLAKNIQGKVEAGDITFTEAAALVGCGPSDAGCKDQVLETLGVDEVVATTVTATPTGLNVTVRRIGKGGAPKAAQTTIPTGKSPDAKLNADIGPLFGMSATTAAAIEPPPPVTTQPPPPTTPPPTTITTTTRPTESKPAPPPPTVANGNAQQVTAAPNGAVTQTPEGTAPSRRLPKILMGVGGGFILLGILMWTQAADVQSQIDDKPEPVSPADFRKLEDLEKKGDDIAGAGNLFFIAGTACAGVGGYLYWKRGRSSSTQTARIAPMVLPNGAGVTLTLGGAP